MISEIYLCKDKRELKTKTGKTYFSLVLQDKTGTIDAKIWDLNPGIEHFDNHDFIKVDGNVTTYQNALQLNIRRVRRAREGEYLPADYMPCTKYNISEMYTELLGYVGSVTEPHLHALLVKLFVEDKDFIASFKAHSAAKSVHHGFVGGLLEHTLSVTKLCDFYTTRYSALNRDLLITAALCHDIGKTRELSLFPANEYTDEGQLIGHIITGTEMISGLISQIPGFPEVLAFELKHCILAHHGELEFGSPKKPALVEAIALSMADNLDAKMESFKEMLSAIPENNLEWQGFNRLFDSNVRRTGRDQV